MLLLNGKGLGAFVKILGQNQDKCFKEFFEKCHFPSNGKSTNFQLREGANWSPWAISPKNKGMIVTVLSSPTKRRAKTNPPSSKVYLLTIIYDARELVGPRIFMCRHHCYRVHPREGVMWAVWEL